MEFDNLSGKTFDIWKVLNFDHMEYKGTNGRHGLSYYACECTKCKKIFIKPRSNLLQDKNKCHLGCNPGGKCHDAI